ncbi:hypothetical protein FRB93_004450 [Tulasnella sp. JGI-2019a]|nr:hypothetical protein FRB93_004450 [Tulasnella sp. JGI-2019a]
MPASGNASMTNTMFLRFLVILLYAIIPYTQAQVQVAPEPPYVVQSFSFGWVGTANSTMTRCRTLNVTLTPRDLAHPPLGPFDLNVYSQFREPLTINQGTTFWHLWTVDLDIGGPYLLSMNDAYGGTGGVSQAFNVVADPLGSTCGSSGMISSALQLDVSAQRAQCSNVSIAVTGGTPPYTLTVVPEMSLPKAVTYSTGTFNYTLDIKAGVNAVFSVVDVLGSGAVSSYFTVAASSDASCLGVAPTLSVGASALSTIYPGQSATASSESSNNTHSSIIGPVIGGVVGGLLFICLGIILGVCLYRRRKREVRNIQEDGRNPDLIRRMSIEDMSTARPPQHGMLMNPHASTINPYEPSSTPGSRPGSYPVSGSSWSSSDGTRPMSGAPMMMMMSGMPGPGGEQRMSMNPDGLNPYVGVQQYPYMMTSGGIPQQQQQQPQPQIIYSYADQQNPTAQYPSQYQPHPGQQVPQLAYYTIQGQPTGWVSGEFGGSSTALSKVSGSGAGGVATSSELYTNTSDEKKERRPSLPTPTPPYEPRK